MALNERPRHHNQPQDAIIGNGNLDALTPAVIHNERKHLLHHPAGITLRARRVPVLSDASPAAGLLPTEDLEFTDQGAEPLLNLHYNTQLRFHIEVPLSALADGNIAVAAWRNGTPTHRTVENGMKVRAKPAAITRGEDYPVDDPDAMAEIVIAEHVSTVEIPGATPSERRTPFEYLLDDDTSAGRKLERWQIVLGRHTHEEGIDRIDPEFLFRFTVSF